MPWRGPSIRRLNSSAPGFRNPVPSLTGYSSGMRLQTYRQCLSACYPVRFASSEMRGKHESGVDYRTNQSRDRQIESGIGPAGRWRSPAGKEAGNDKRTQEEAQIVGSGKGENCSSSKSTMVQDPGREEIEAGGFPTTAFLSLKFNYRKKWHSLTHGAAPSLGAKRPRATSWGRISRQNQTTTRSILKSGHNCTVENAGTGTVARQLEQKMI